MNDRVWICLKIMGIRKTGKKPQTGPEYPPIMVGRCNGTTAGLGYLEVNVICPCKSPPWAVG
jgi:hypothetical protein